MDAPLEKAKYQGIYSNEKRYAKYGHSNHGAKSKVIFDMWDWKSLLDVGCGFNEFVKDVRTKGKRAIGVDFACPGADMLADATKLPFTNDSFDVVTAFDCLEHLLEAQVPLVLSEMARVGNGFIFSISYVASKITWKGQNLHPTVKPEAWWIDQIKAAGALFVRKHGRYLWGRWKDKSDIRKAPPVAPGKSVVLVGNGPSIVGQGKGSLIDSFDEVLRFNSFHIEGFEKDVGIKTTIWSTFGKGTYPGDIALDKERKPDPTQLDAFLKSDRAPRRIIYIHGLNNNPMLPWDEIWRIPIEYFNKLRAKVQATSKRTGEDNTRLLGSSGLLVASWLLDIGVPKLHLIGFDHFKRDVSRAHHYWFGSKVFGEPKEHDGVAETEMMSKFEEQGRIEYL